MNQGAFGTPDLAVRASDVTSIAHNLVMVAKDRLATLLVNGHSPVVGASTILFGNPHMRRATVTLLTKVSRCMRNAGKLH